MRIAQKRTLKYMTITHTLENGLPATAATSTTEARKTVSTRTPPRVRNSGKREAPAVSKPRPSKQRARRTTPHPRGGSKGATILNLIGRSKGATLAELMKATGWQAHSVRGFLATAKRKNKIKIRSDKNESGERLYRASK
jgi:hypothetical protein